MELITMHTHTSFTGHGHATVEELVRAAVAAGISTLAITEHYPLSDAFDPNHYVSMPFSQIGQYCDDIERARQAYPNIEIITGCELDWLGADEDRALSPSDFSPFSLVLGSLHLIDRWAFDAPSQIEQWKLRGADAVWKRYFELWCEAAASDGPFQVMAHPDLPKKFGFYPSFDLQPLYDRAAEACVAGGRMIEVNTSGMWYACREMFPAPALLATFCRAQIPCTVGTDAHTPDRVACGITEAYRVMYDAGYRKVTVPTADGDHREIPIR